MRPQPFVDFGGLDVHDIRGERLGGEMKPRLHVEHVTAGRLFSFDLSQF